MAGGFFSFQTLILIGCSLFVFYLAGIPLVMLLYGSIRSAPIGEPGAAYTAQNYVKAYFDREFYLLFWNSLSAVLSIMAFDLWEGGQYTYVTALGS